MAGSFATAHGSREAPDATFATSEITFATSEITFAMSEITFATPDSPFAAADAPFPSAHGVFPSPHTLVAPADAALASPNASFIARDISRDGSARRFATHKPPIPAWTEAVDPRRAREHPPRVPQRKNYLFVCVNSRPDGTPKGSCAARGAVEIHAALKMGLATRGLAKLEARACTASCVDVCWAGPVVAVEPAGHFYGHVTLADVPEILEALANGTRVERLVLSPEDFDEATARPPLPVLKS